MAAILTNGVPAAISSILLPLPLARSNYAGAAPRSPDLLPTALARGRARLHICGIAIGAVTEPHRRTPQPAPGRRAKHSQHFSQAPARAALRASADRRADPGSLKMPSFGS